MILRMVGAKLDLERSLNLLDTLSILDSWTDSSMTAKDSLLLICHNRSERHLLESLIDLGKDTIWIIDIFTQSL